MMDTEFLLRLLNISGVSGNEMEATLLCKKIYAKPMPYAPRCDGQLDSKYS